MTRALVTGATGFLGRNVIDFLAARGFQIAALVRNDHYDLVARGVETFVGDVLDEESVCVAAERCEVVFHCAGLVSRDPADAEQMHRVHVVGSRTVICAARRAAVRRVVIASTSGTVAVSTDPDHVARESDPIPFGILAQFPYYRAKLYAEQESLAANGDGLEVVSINPSLLLGPGDLRGTSTDDVRLFLERRIPAVPSGGLSFVDVRDAAEAMVLGFERGVAGERYLIAAANMTMGAFFGRLERLSGVRAPWMVLPHLPSATGEGLAILERLLRRAGLSLPVDRTSLLLASHTWYVDPSKAEAELGWRARDPAETLADTVADLRDRGVVWPEVEGPTGLAG